MTDQKTGQVDGVKKPDCDHIGHWASAGTITLQEREGILIIICMICSKCGAAQSKSIRMNSIPVATGGIVKNFRGN